MAHVADDLSSRLDDISNIGESPFWLVELAPAYQYVTPGAGGAGQERPESGERPGGYEKDIRDIVEYFERSCHVRDKLQPFHRYLLLNLPTVL